ncbi:MAG: Malonyl CoA-acyl carrier protein transacylase [Chthoniobacteraceae bacterium]|nr:Malonyl CoA-acyl carrier protein transacylase [Chthoniobacteraceae bacterium]MDB6171811.1 Malonyl CoA-acyl carrier protein transacylase [Chthoniobacteraceae bacterium]
MNKRIAILFSGQGAQTVGMGKDLAARYPAVAELFNKADTILGRPLSQIAFEGPEDELTETKNCQPALFIHGLACLMALRQEIGEFPIQAAAGLSLGEFTAHAAAGTFDFETGLRLVAKRGIFMQEACEQTSGAMAAMIGAEENTVRSLAAETDVDIANLNSPGQIVISGESAKVILAVSMAKDHGIRIAKLLNVAGAYHSRLMNSAFLKLGDELQRTTFAVPQFPVICNTDATPVREPEEIRSSLQDQVTDTVHWTDTMEHLLDQEKCELFIELGPGSVLSGLLNRTRKGTPCVSISDCASLDAAIAILRGLNSD